MSVLSARRGGGAREDGKGKKEKGKVGKDLNELVFSSEARKDSQLAKEALSPGSVISRLCL